MAVPNTSTFSLQDVVDTINPTTDDLQDCVNDAVGSQYDATYYTAPATSLLEFRNYGATPCNTTQTLNFYPDSGQASSGSGTCPTGGSEAGYYFYPTATDIGNGDTVTTDPNGCSPFNGGNLYYRVRDNVGGGFSEIQINSSGVVSNKTSCT